MSRLVLGIGSPFGADRLGWLALDALASAGRGDFAVANRLHRTRSSLSAAALAYLALAFAEMDRKATAAELIEVLQQRELEAV